MRFLRTAAVAAALLVGLSTAQAGFKLRLSSGSTTSNDILLSGSNSNSDPNKQDLLAGGDTDLKGGYWHYDKSSGTATTGIKIENLTAFGYFIAVTFAQSNSPSGDPARLFISSILITKTGAATGDLTLSLTSDGFTKPSVNRYLNTKVTGFIGTGSFTSYYDTANKEFGTTGGTVTSRTVTGATGPGGVNTDLPSGTPTFSLTDTMVFSGLDVDTTYDSASISTSVLPVPAPPAIVLAALGIPALGLVRRFTRKTATEAVVA